MTSIAKRPGLTKDAAAVQSLRETLLAQKAADTVSISAHDGQSLPYIDNLVNLIIGPKTTTVSEAEMLRVLAPLGRAIIGDKVVGLRWHGCRRWGALHQLGRWFTNSFEVREGNTYGS